MQTDSGTIEYKREPIDTHPTMGMTMFILAASLSMGALVWAILG